MSRTLEGGLAVTGIIGDFANTAESPYAKPLESGPGALAWSRLVNRSREDFSGQTTDWCHVGVLYGHNETTKPDETVLGEGSPSQWQNFGWFLACLLVLPIPLAFWKG